jgi:hypothetical protein
MEVRLHRKHVLTKLQYEYRIDLPQSGAQLNPDLQLCCSLLERKLSVTFSQCKGNSCKGATDAGRTRSNEIKIHLNPPRPASNM